MHANFILCLFSSSDHHHHSTRSCLQSCGGCLRKIFRRFCVCLVICLWSFSFTATIPLLYSMDSNEKSLPAVYCPGTKQISYLEEWFNRNRFIQTIICNLIPFLLNLFLSIIALLKLLYDALAYIFIRCKMSKCSPCRKKSNLFEQQRPIISNSISFLSSLSIVARNNMQYGINLSPMVETTTTTTTTPDSEFIVTPSDLEIESCGRWLSKSFVRSLLVLSACLLACIYPIVMRFYLIYFSVLVPLIFAVLNYSFAQLTSTQQQTTVENYVTSGTNQAEDSPDDLHQSLTMNRNRVSQTQTSIKHERTNNSLHEQFELETPLIKTVSNEQDESIDHQKVRSTLKNKQQYFSNRLYESSRTMFSS